MKYHGYRVDIIEEINRAVELQLSEIFNALYDGNSKILAAIGCMNLLEYLGGLRTGKLGIPNTEERGVVRKRFNAGFDLIKLECGSLGKDKFYALRCSLTHEFNLNMQEEKEIWIINDIHNTDEDRWPPYRDVPGNKFKRDVITVDAEIIWINVLELYNALCRAWEKFKKVLEYDDELLRLAQISIERTPRLLTSE